MKFLPVFEMDYAVCDLQVSVCGFKELHISTKVYTISEKDNLPSCYSHNLQVRS